jgi:hypothetical protein
MMKCRWISWTAISLLFLFSSFTNILASLAGLSAPMEQFALSDAVFRGTVLENTSYRDAADGLIYTRTLLRVDEPLKGHLPPVIRLVHRGGTLEDVGQTDGLTPQFRVAEERLVYAKRRRDGTLFATLGNPSAVRLWRSAGSGAFLPAHESLLTRLRIAAMEKSAPVADLTDQAGDSTGLGFSQAPLGDQGGNSSNGLLVDAKGVPARLITCDRGAAIPYLVDAASLPQGIDLNQALTAVSNAFAAWTAVTSLKFSFAGLEPFGMAAPDIQARDGIVRVQLHDLYGVINNPQVLGLGGTYFSTPVLTNAGWGTGGRVAGTEFNQVLCGYVVIEHTNIAVQTPSGLSEVLCHEIGHVIGLAHSSEDPNETNVFLSQAMMYFQAHGNGRGASLGAYDPPVADRINPLANPPPFCFNRVMDIITSAGSLSGPGINQIEMRGYSLDSSPTTLCVTNRTAKNGSFTQNGWVVNYTPKSAFSDVARLDPAGLNYYDILYARHADGSNASPYVMVRVISYSLDSFPASASDGIPDNWMVAHFGAGFANPALGSKHHAYDDPDRDGLTNLQEYRAGMDPLQASSAQLMFLAGPNLLTWQAKPYELYELQGSTDLTHWSRICCPAIPTTATGTISNFWSATAPWQFLRILKVP